jgi:two-component sensor histidine kinase
MRELAPEHEEHWFERYGRIALTGEPARFEESAAALGRWYDVYAFRVDEPEQRRVAILFRDISERKRAEGHRELLIHELNHRVKNTLATVQSFTSQTLRNAKGTAEAREILDSRLVALAKAHDVLTRERWEGAHLSEIVANAIAPYSGDGRTNRFHVEGVDLRLQTRSALAFSMALHELGTNAVKYGALSNGTGTVAIDWNVTQGSPQRFRLRWAESGGPPVEKPRRRGFGSRLVERGLAQDLGGEVQLDFKRSGLICTIDAPLSEIFGGDEQPSKTSIGSM